MIVSEKRNQTNYLNLYINRANITETEHHTHLGETMSNNFSWSAHTSGEIATADKRLFVIQRCQHILPRNCTETQCSRTSMAQTPMARVPRLF